LIFGVLVQLDFLKESLMVTVIKVHCHVIGRTDNKWYRKAGLNYYYCYFLDGCCYVVGATSREGFLVGE